MKNETQQFLMPVGISDKLMGLYQLCGALFFSPLSSSCHRMSKRVLALAVLFSFLVWNISPIYGFDAQFVEGSGTIETDGNTTTVTVNGPAVLEGNMSIPEFNTVQVIQGSNDLLMRDITGMRTDWLGSLIADGRIVLVNTQGVFIASTANIDVKSLIASTLDISNELFMNNQLHFEKVAGMDAAKILNEANITIKEGQSLVFLADAIENRGNITAYLGTVAMGVGTKATVSFDAGGMINLVVDQGLESLGVDAQGNVITPLLNTGTISADGGKVQMSAKMLNATMDQLINNSGVIEATKVLEHDGMVEFVSNGAVVNEGMLRATNVEEQGATFRSSGIMEVGEMMMDNLDGAADISGSIAGTYSDVGNIRMVGNVTLTGATMLRADSNNDGVGKVDMQTFAITGGANNLTLYTGESTTLNSIATTGTLSIYASTGNPTYTVGTNLSIGALSLYSGTLDMNGKDLTLGGAYTQSGGTFTGGSGTKIFSGAFTQSGGVFNGGTGMVTHAGVFTLSGGTYNATSGTTTFGNAFSQSGGTFNGGTGAIDLNGDFTLSVGTFNAPYDPSGVNGKMNFAGNFTINNTGGSFIHNNGTLIFDGAGKTIDVLLPLDVYNFEVTSSNYLGIAAGDTVVVNGALTLTNGTLYSPSGSGTLNAKGAISVASTFDGGYSSGSPNLLIDGTVDQSFIIPNGAIMPKITLNNPLTTITATADSALIFPSVSSFTLQSGTFDLNGANVTFSGGFSQSGGTFYGGTGTITSGSTFSLLGGSFTNSTADTMTVADFILSHGTFLAPSGTMTVTGHFTVDGTGDFQHNDGKVIFSGTDKTFTGSAPIHFNDFEMNAGTYMRVASGTVLVMNGDLVLTKGALLGNSNNGTINAKGDVLVGSTFGGGYSSSNTCNLLIDGPGIQNVTIAAGAKMPKTTLNNPLAVLTLSGPGTVTWNDATASLILQDGKVDLNGGNATFAGSFSQSGGIFYGRTGVITSSNTFSLLGGSFTNSTADTMTVADFILSHGTFLAPSGTMTVTGHFTVNGTGDFQHNDGKVIFSGTDKGFTGSVPIHFNDFEMNAGTYMRVQTGTVLIVNGDLTLTKGALLGYSNNGTVHVKGDISVAAAFGGGYPTGYVCNLLIDGTGIQNVTIAAGAKMPKTTLNNPLAVLSLSGPGTVTWNDTTGGTLTLLDGTVDLNGGSAVFSKGFSQSGGIFYGRTGTISTTTFDLSGGTFNAPTGAFALSSTYNQSGGIFNGGSGAMTIAGVFTQSGGVFDAGIRTVALSGNFTLSGGTFKTGTSRITFGDAAADTVTISGGVLEIQSDDTTQTGDIVKNASTWTNSGGTILYDAASSSNLKIRSGLGTSYYNLIINASGLTYTLDGNLDVNGNFTIGAGTGVDVSASNYNMTVAGNWSNSGTFAPRSGTVTLDGTNQSITGSTTFNNLTKSLTAGSPVAETLTFESNSTQTVAGVLTLRGYNSGSTTKFLSLVSSAPGSQWNIVPGASRSISYADVMDSGSSIAIDVSGQHNINSANNTNWVFGTPDRYTWIGGGADSKWSTAGNWQDGYIPGASDMAVFSADSAIDCTIDVATVGDVYVSAGYTGTLTQAGSLAVSGLANGFIQRGGTYVVGAGTMTLNKAFTLAGGTFDLASNALTTASNIAFTQSGGTFIGGSGTVDLNGDFVLSGGTFNAPGRLIEGGPQGTMNFNNHFTVSGTGNFVHHNGALIFDGYNKIIDVMNPLEVYDFEVKATSSGYMGIAAGDTVVVRGMLTLKDGVLYSPSGTGVLNAKGAVSVASTFDGGNASGSPLLLIDGSGDQSFTIPAGAIMPKILLNNPLTTITATAGSTLIFPTASSLTIQSGNFDLNGANLVLNSAYTQSGGTFYGRMGFVDLNGDFMLSGGTFNAPGRLVDGGVQGVMNFNSNFTVSGSGNFVHNNGSLVFDGAGKFIDVETPLDLYDFEVRATSSYMGLGSGDTVIVNGGLTLTNGAFYSPLGTGVLNARGAISVASTFDGGNASGSPYLLIDGSGDQSFVIPGGALMPKTILNNPLTTIKVESGGTITFPSASLLTLQSGIFDLDGGSVNFTGGFTQTGGTFYGGTGTISSSGTFSLLGGSFINSTADTMTVADFILSHGTFLAPSGTMTVTGHFTVDGTGDFQHNDGKVIFSGTDKTFTGSTPIHFNDFEMNAGTYMRIASGTVLVMNGDLVLTKGILLGNSNNGTINAKGDVLVASTFGGGYPGNGYTCALTIDGTGVQNVTIAAGGKMPKTILNNPLAALSLSGAGTVTWSDPTGGLIFQAGTVDLNGVNATFSGGFSQSGGSFYGRTGAISTTTFALSDGIFDAGSGNMTISGIFTLSGGTYNSTSGTQTQTGAVTVSGGTYTLGSNSTIATLTIGSNGTFDLNGKNLTTTTFTNGGTLKLQGGETVSTAPTLQLGSTVVYTKTNGSAVMKDWSYYNLTLDGVGGTFMIPSDKTLGGTLTINAGVFDQGARNITAPKIVIGSQGAWVNNSTGDITVGNGGVTNNGYIRLDGSGVGPGNDADAIVIRSLSDGTQQTWAGSGIFRVIDVDVKDQSGAVIAYSSTNAGNTDWTFESVVPTEKTWIGNGADSNWTTGANWLEGEAPLEGETAIFDILGTNKPVTINVATVHGIQINVGYAGTLTQANDLEIGLGHYVQSGATYSAGTYQLTMTGEFTLAGGSFTAPSSTMIVSRDFSIAGGTFTANGGDILFNGVTFLRSNGTIFNNVQVGTDAVAATVLLQDNLKVGGDLQVGSLGLLNAVSHSIQEAGDWHFDNITNLGAVTLAGTDKTIYSGGNFGNLTVSGAYVLNDALTATGELAVSGTLDAAGEAVSEGGNWTADQWTKITNFGDVTLTGSGKQIAGTDGVFTNLRVNGTYTNNLTGILTVGTALTGSGTLTQGSNATLNLGGTAMISGLNATASGNTVNYNKAGDQTVKGTAYYDLIVSNSGTKTIGSGASIAHTGTISDAARVLLTVSASGINKVYDATNTATVNLSTNNIFTAYAVAPSGIYTAVFTAGKNVGTGKAISVTGISLLGADAAKFISNTTASATANITKAVVTLSGITASDRVYDQTIGATVSTVGAIFNGMIAGDNLTVSSTGAFADKNAGMGKTVTLTNTFGGTDLGNYAITDQGTTTASITPKAVTLGGITASDKVYDQTIGATVSTAGAIFNGMISGDTLTVSSSGVFGDKNVGAGKTVTLTNTLGGTDLGNYAITDQGTTTASITPKAVTLGGITASDKVYDQTIGATVSTSGATFNGMISGDTLTVSSSGVFGDKNVGAGKTVTLTNTLGGTDLGNYAITDQGTTTASITPKAVTLGGITASDKVYDSTTAATVNKTNAVFAGKYAGDDLAVSSSTGVFSDKNAASGKTVILANSFSGGDLGNYSITDQGTTTASIEKRTLTVDATGVNRIYDGTSAATVTLSDNRILGDVMTTSYGSASFSDRFVGAGKAVSVSGLAISGVDAANYALSSTTDTTAANITAVVTGAISGLGSGISVALSLNGGTPVTTTTTDANGSFAFGGDLFVRAGDSMLIYANNDAYKANLVGQVKEAASVTGLSLAKDAVSIGSVNAVNLDTAHVYTGAGLIEAKGSLTNHIFYSMSSGTLTVNADLSVAGKYAQDGNLVVNGDFTVEAGGKFTDASPLAHSFSVTGDFSVPYENGAFDRYESVSGVKMIRDIYDLQAMKSNLSSDFKMSPPNAASGAWSYEEGNGVWIFDASGATEWNAGAGFSPIGDATHAFTGTLDGNSTVIANLTEQSTSGYAGFFGNIGAGGTVENLGLEDVSIHALGQNYVGGLAGLNAGSLTNVYTTGAFTVEGANFVGGLVGRNTGDISKAYSSARVKGDLSVGGLVGENAGHLENVYAIGYVTGTGNTGGLMGSGAGAVLNSFWDKEMTGQDQSSGSLDAGGKTTEDMMKGSTYSGWDFYSETDENGSWVMDEGGTYAHLKWRYPNGVRGVWGKVLDADGGAEIGSDMKIGLYIGESETGEGVGPIMSTRTGASSMYYFVLGNEDPRIEPTDYVIGGLMDPVYSGNTRMLAETGSIPDLDIWGHKSRVIPHPHKMVVVPVTISFDKDQMIEDLSQAQNTIQPIGGILFQSAVNGVPQSAEIFISEDVIQTPVEEGRTEFRKLANPARTEYRKFTGPGIMFAAQSQPGREPLPANR